MKYQPFGLLPPIGAHSKLIRILIVRREYRRENPGSAWPRSGFVFKGKQLGNWMQGKRVARMLCPFDKSPDFHDASYRTTKELSPETAKMHNTISARRKVYNDSR